MCMCMCICEYVCVGMCTCIRRDISLWVDLGISIFGAHGHGLSVDINKMLLTQKMEKLLRNFSGVRFLHGCTSLSLSVSLSLSLSLFVRMRPHKGRISLQSHRGSPFSCLTTVWFCSLAIRIRMPICMDGVDCSQLVARSEASVRGSGTYGDGSFLDPRATFLIQRDRPKAHFGAGRRIFWPEDAYYMYLTG